MTDAPLVSVVIPNHNGVHHLKECLESVLNTNYPTYEVILVDNNSSDGSAELVSKEILPTYAARKIPLRIITSSANLGFARGNNLGARFSKGEYVVFLNNDTKVHPDWICELAEVMEKDTTIGIAQCKIMKEGSENVIDSVGFNLYLTGMSANLACGELDAGQYDYVHEISAAHAGIAMFRRRVLETVGGFDPDFFIMKEDDDISLRTWLSGWRIVLAPRSIVYHKGGGTISRFKRILTLYYMIRNEIAVMLKSYEVRSLILYSIPSMLLHLAKGFLRRRNRGRYLCAYSKGLSWILLNLKVILSKRRIVQKLRKVSDKELIARRVLNKPRIDIILRKTY